MVYGGERKKMNNLVCIDQEKLINLCPYVGAEKNIGCNCIFSECKKKKGLDCSYVLSGCHFDDIQVIFDDDDGHQD